jgi:proline iminopeptidase
MSHRYESRWIWAQFALICSILTTAAHAQAPQLTQGVHIAEINGVHIKYFVAGTGPLLIVQGPGWGLGSEYLRRGLVPLEAHFTLVFYDTRGSGQSSRPADESRMRTLDMIDDLEGLRRFWRIPRLLLMGHSHGGTIALGYAIRYPTHVKKLVLVDSGIIDFDFSAPIKQQLENRKNDKRFEDAIASLNSGGSISTDAELVGFLNHIWPLFFYDPDRYLASFVASFSELPSAWVFNKHPENDGSLKEDGVLSAVRTPTLIIAGRNDWVCGPVVAEHLHAEIGNSEIRILEKTGHFPWVEDPVEFFAAVVDWVSSPNAATARVRVQPGQYDAGG